MVVAVVAAWWVGTCKVPCAKAKDKVAKDTPAPPRPGSLADPDTDGGGPDPDGPDDGGITNGSTVLRSAVSGGATRLNCLQNVMSVAKDGSRLGDGS